jgi:hypothetical protein
MEDIEFSRPRCSKRDIWLTAAGLPKAPVARADLSSRSRLNDELPTRPARDPGREAYFAYELRFVLGAPGRGTATKGEALVPVRWNFSRIDRPS